ncbi:hypothetical protein VE25_06535 [Devosia geojensis]|uniref:L,D-transpeptidase n=1 Tax=Devosia geojensis TaxID=443610 RepID=A0A0F5FVK2_9HYPH|nr:hypothetical protein [Devosia geojensis]KKB12575.1 hypothetical protein VE25_06535 [Devosia geojensis]
MSFSRSAAIVLTLACGLVAGSAQANEVSQRSGLSERAIIIVGGKGETVSLNPQPLPPGIEKQGLNPQPLPPGFTNPWVRQGLNPQPLPPGRF